MRHHAKSILNPRLPRGSLALAAVCLALLLGGGRVAFAQVAVNKMCPVMPLEEADPAFTTVYEGKTIGFCCERCLGKFKANPGRYAARLTALPENESDPKSASKPEARGESQEAHNHGENGAEQAHDEPAHDEPGHDGAGEQRKTETESDADHEHNHGADASGFARLIAWLGRFHPSVVHFPIAMLFGAAVAELLWIVRKRELFALAGRFCLWFGGLTAIVAGGLGWFFAGFQLTNDTWILTTHRWLGTATVLWAIATLFVGECTYRAMDPSKRGAYRAMLLVSAVAVLVTGFLGGAMIYGIDHHAW